MLNLRNGVLRDQASTNKEIWNNIEREKNGGTDGQSAQEHADLNCWALLDMYVHIIGATDKRDNER